MELKQPKAMTIRERMEEQQEWIQQAQLEQARRCQEIAELADYYGSKWILDTSYINPRWGL